VPRQHRSLGETDESVRVQVQTDARDQRRVRLVVADRLTGLMEGDERGRASGIDGHARTVQVEHIGKAIGGNTAGVAGHGGRVDRAQIVGATVGVVDARQAHIDAAATAAHRCRGDARLLEGFQGHLEQYPLLRIHLLGFPRGNPEKRCVESRNVTDRTRGKRIGRPGLGLIRMQEGVLGPAVGLYRSNEIAACQQRLPEGFVGTAWQPKRETDHRYPSYVPVICHVRIVCAESRI
jgi:hypothetical protein